MQKVILRASTWMFLVFLFLTFSANWGVRYAIEERRFMYRAEEKFFQIDQILQENTQDIALLEEDFSQQCLTYAASAAYVAEYNPDIRTDLAELRKVANLLGVDEIHFFDDTGMIYAGTHPEYYGYNFHSGAQMEFFAPMLTDRTLSLCQDIQPNTAEAKLMQYAAVWNESKTEIVQIGVTPNRVLDAQAGKSISDVFSMLASSTGEVILAVDPETFKIVGATDLDYVRGYVQNFDIVPDILPNTPPRDAQIFDGKHYVYATYSTHNFTLIHCYERAEIVKAVTMDSILASIYIFIFAVVATTFIMVYLNRKIVRSIWDINRGLEEIEQGDLSITFQQDSVPEVKALSDHINSMVFSLIRQSHNLSIALDLAQIPAGIIEYNAATKTITATDKVQELLGLSHPEFIQACTSADALSAKLKEIISTNTMVENNVLRIDKTHSYVKIDRFEESGNSLILVMDISKEIVEKEILKHERDTDVLTNLYNRRAFYRKMHEVLAEKTSPWAAVCIIDLDNLKEANDIYGHEVGDIYIQNVVKLIQFEGDFIAGRLGGDEFIALLYNAQSEEQLQTRIDAFGAQQDQHFVTLDDSQQLPLSFSIGYAMTPNDGTDYLQLIKIADTRMYDDKCIRKGGAHSVRHGR